MITDSEKIKNLQAEMRHLNNEQCRDLLMMVSGWMSTVTQTHTPDFWRGVECLLEEVKAEYEAIQARRLAEISKT